MIDSNVDIDEITSIVDDKIEDVKSTVATEVKNEIAGNVDESKDTLGEVVDLLTQHEEEAEQRQNQINEIKDTLDEIQVGGGGWNEVS